MAYRPPHKREPNYTSDSKADERTNAWINDNRTNDRGYNNHKSTYNNSSYNKSSYNNSTTYDDTDDYTEELKQSIRKKDSEILTLKADIAKLTQENQDLNNKLQVYISKGAKVDVSVVEKLKDEYDNYRATQYTQNKALKEKLDAQTNSNQELNKQVRELEEKLRLSTQQVHQYKSSVQDLNQKLKEMKKVSTIKPQSVEQSTESVQSLDDPNLIPDDWRAIIAAVDLVLSLDKKLLKGSSVNIRNLQMARTLLKPHE